MTDIRPLVAGNWKMNGLKESLQMVERLCKMQAASSLPIKTDIMICPPSTLLLAVSHILSQLDILTGAQDCHTEISGAHTGDISAEMLADAGASAVIVGHSERRANHSERNRDVYLKTLAAYRAGLSAIICLGESGYDRKSGKTLEIVRQQLNGSLPSGAKPGNTIIAYEPVWAIGTGLTPELEEIAEVHAFIRSELGSLIEKNYASSMRILYGGSVTPDNARELMAVENVNGALIGGASLKPEDFLAIISVYA